MTQFSYSFCMALLHSFWQAALLLLLYISIDKFLLKNNSPLAKRNFLYISLTTQFILFALTFIIYFSETQNTIGFTNITHNLIVFLGSENIRLITPWAFNLYIFIITFKLIKAIYSWYSFKLHYKTGLQKPAIDLKLFTELKAHQFGIKRIVKLWLSSTIHTPVTFGFFKPVILLPVALLNNISLTQAETLILHELTHIRTNDYLLNWFLLITETIFFFNPFVKSICKNIRLEREKNCDINVMAFAYSPALYAETLLQAERIKQLVPNFQLAAVTRKKQLLQRIQFFSGHTTFSKPLRIHLIAPLIGFILLLMLFSAILFRSNNTVLTPQTTAALPYLPLSSLELKDADFVHTNLPGDKDVEKMVNEMEKQKPERQIKKSGPTIKNIQHQIEIIAKQVDQNFSLPVSVTENDAARQIIIKEESSGSASASVKVYNLSFENGQWILQPEWIVYAREITLDSLSGKIDSLGKMLKRIVPAQQ